MRSRRIRSAVGDAVPPLAPSSSDRYAPGRAGVPETPAIAWALSEMMRHSARDIAEAGRELGRFDSRPWLRPLDVPSAVVLTTRDEAVAPGRQRALAAALQAPVFEAPISHLQITTSGSTYNPVLLRALDAVRGRERVATA